MCCILLATSKTDSIAQFVTVFIVFVLVLAMVYGTTVLVGKGQKLYSNNRNFEAIETFKVTNNKYLQLVRVGTRYFVIAIGKDTITYLQELDESELDLSVKNGSDNDKFAKIFDSAKNKLSKRGEK